MNIEHKPKADRINKPSKELVYDDSVVIKYDRSTCEIFSFAAQSEVGQLQSNSPVEGGGGKYLLATSSGNQYIVGDGFIVNMEKSKIYLMPEGLMPPDVRFGEPWRFGEGLKTSAVTALAQGVSVSQGNMPKLRMEGESPFLAVDKIIAIEAKKRTAHRDTLGASAPTAAERMPRNNRERLGLPRGFKTEKGSVYKYTPEGHSERWKFDGTHHAPMGIAVFLEDTPENLDAIQRDALVDSHCPVERRFKSYIIEKTTDGCGNDSMRKVYDARDIVDPGNVYFARMNAYSQIEMLRPASIAPKVGYHVYEFRKEKDGKRTTRHPGHRVSEILT